MAYLVHVTRLAEDDVSVEYAYSGSGWDCGRGQGRFRVDKATQEVVLLAEPGTAEGLAERGLRAVLRHWRAI